MSRWNHDYYSRIRKNIKDSEVGITLVELLAAISILSIVILLAGSVHMFGQRQFMNQADSAHRSNDLSYGLSVLTSDLRKVAPDAIAIETNPTKLKIVNPQKKSEVLVTYKVEDNQLLKNEEIITDSVSRMEIVTSGAGTYSLIIKLYSNSEKSPDKEYTTTVVFRGVSNE